MSNARAAVVLAKRLADPAVLLECFAALLDLTPNQKVFAEAQSLSSQKSSAEITDERLRSVFFSLMCCEDSSCPQPNPGAHEQLNISKPPLDNH